MIGNEDYASLMQNVSANDTAAFEKIVKRFGRALINYFYQLCWDEALSEDMSQETLLKVWRSREKYKASAQFSTYLFTVAVNVWRDELRRKNRKLKIVAKEYIELEKYAVINSRDDGIEDILEKKSVSRDIKKAIEELDEKHRQPFILSEIGGMSYKQIADVLEIPVGTVRSRKFNAYRKIRDKLSVLRQTGEQK